MTTGVHCTRSGCKSTDGKWYPQIRVWAIGYDKQQTAPCAVTFALAHCDACRDKVVLADLVGDRLKATVRAALKAQRRAPPNFSEAELHWCAADSPDVLALFRAEQ